MKQVELYNKWRPLVPDEYKDAICPKPSDAILEVVKKERAEKKKKIVQKDAVKWILRNARVRSFWKMYKRTVIVFHGNYLLC